MSIKIPTVTHSIQPAKRFLPGSKLFDVGGSVAQRRAHKKLLHENFNRLFDGALDKSDEISFEELKAIYKKVVPDINLHIKNRADILGGVSVSSKNGESIDGLNLSLRLGDNITKVNKSDEKTISTIDHENEHIFTLITEPKLLLNFISEPLSEGASLMQLYFYKTKLYSDISEKASLFQNYDKFPKIKVFLNSLFLDSRKKKIETDEKYRKKIYTKEIKRFIKTNKLNEFENIEILKRWRRLLLGEKEAYSHQANQDTERFYSAIEKKIKSILNIDIDFSGTSEKLEGHSEEFKEYFEKYLASKNKLKDDSQTLYASTFDFDGKIAVIEKMFLERVSIVRAGFKEKYCKT